MRRMKLTLAFTAAVALAAVDLSAQTGSGASKILSVDHKVTVKSIVPAIAGQPTQIYVRERVAEGMKNPPPEMMQGVKNPPPWVKANKANKPPFIK